MSDTPAPCRLSSELRFAAFATESREALRRAVEAIGGTIEFCDVFTESDWRDVARAQRQAVSQFANQLLTGEIDFVVFVTATGLNYFIQRATRQVDGRRLLHSLTDSITIAGSPEAARAFETLGIRPTISVDRPSSWRDVLIALDQKVKVINFNVGLEESDSIHGLSSGIEARGGRVYPLPIYSHTIPTQGDAVVECFRRLKTDDVQILVFTSPAEVSQFYFLAKSSGNGRWLSQLNHDLTVIAIGAETAELLRDRHIPIDLSTTNLNLETAIHEIVGAMNEIQQEKNTIRNRFADPGTSGLNPNAPWYDNPFMKACRGEPTEVTPIWMMRQAGRYMQEYREVRAKVEFLELCANPQLCSEVMCTAVNRLGVDAAIIFSDLLPILVPMGMDLEFAKGDGPQIHNPIRDAKDVDRVQRLENNDELMFVMETVTQTRQDLPDDIPLIGFAGAPFTLASYMIEGGSSRNYAHTKRLMYTEPTAWNELMQHLSHSISIYLHGQIKAGAQVLQLFDSWAGCLGFDDYRTYVLPYVQQILQSLPRHVPVINFATGNPSLLPLLADTPAAVIGVDWRIRLDAAWQIVGHARSVQGNLDPTVLLTDPPEIRRQAKLILDQAAGRPGHIFNLGHGILPQTPVENAIALVDAVHELSQR